MRDTIARQSDVDKSLMKYEIEPGSKGKYQIGTITFYAKKGKSIDLEKIHQDIKATRLSGKTHSEVKYLEITAAGMVAASDKETRLEVAGTGQQFALADDPKAKTKKGEKTAFQRLQDALAKGEEVVSVTGLVQGWSGLWPEVLREFPGKSAKKTAEAEKSVPKKMPVLIVTDFQTSKK